MNRHPVLFQDSFETHGTAHSMERQENAMKPCLWLIGISLAVTTALYSQDEYTEPFVKDSTYDAAIPSPDDVLGYPLGSKAASHAETLRYFQLIAGAVANAKLMVYAQSHENRDLIYLIISSAENLDRLDEIKTGIQKLFDPRKLSGPSEAESIISTSPAVAWMSYAIHGDELSSTDAAIWLAYQLAAGQDEITQSILENVVVIIDPLQNPDGRERILDLLKIYRGNIQNPDVDSVQFNGVWPWGRGNHYWFDLNRDFFIQAHPESRGRIKGFLEWCPQFFLDSHEMGPLDTYLFSPPRQPINHNIPDNFHKWIDRFSRDQANAFDRYGWSYYTREWFEDWYPGYSFWTAYTGAITVLYEQAGVQGSAVRRPDGTTMSYRETVHHQITSSMANLKTVADNRRELLHDYYQVKQETIAPPQANEVRYYLIQPGADKTRENDLIDKLLWQGIEVFQLEQDTTFRDIVSLFGETIELKQFPTGTWIIPVRQPQKRLIHAIMDFDPQLTDAVLADERFHLEKKNESRMYDWTAWSMLLAYGVDGYSTSSDTRFDCKPVMSLEPIGDRVPDREPNYGYLIKGDDRSSTLAATKLLENRIQLRISEKEFTNDGNFYPAGSFLIRKAENPGIELEQIHRIVKGTGVTVRIADTALSLESVDLGGGYFHLLTKPKIAVITQSPIHPYSYGYTWYFLDVAYPTRMSGLDIGALAFSDLRKYNVLIVPSSFDADVLDRTLHETGYQQLKTWIEAGGTLIALGSSVKAFTNEKNNMSSVRERGDALDQLDVYLEFVDREKKALTAAASKKDVYEYSTEDVQDATSAEGKSQKDKDKLKRDEAWERRFSPQGAFLRVRLDPYHWLTYGVGDPLAVMVDGPDTYYSKAPVQTPVRFVDGASLRVSGLLWPEARKRFAQSAYLTQERVGRGQIILFPFEPHLRGYFPATQRILWNAIFLGPGLGTDQPIPW